MVAVKSTNEGGQPPKESMEPRGGAEGNVSRRHAPDTEPGKACHSSWIAYGEAVTFASPSNTQGGSHMRKFHTYGSLRGARSNLS